MAARPSFAKRDRERSKKAKADQKRERRFDRDPAEGGELPPVGDASEELDAAELLRLVEATQEAFDAEEIDFDEYEERKAALLARLTVD